MSLERRFHGDCVSSAISRARDLAVPIALSLSRDATYTQRGGLATGLRRRGGLGFLPRRALTSEETHLASLDLRGRTVYDIGAFEGVTTLYFARAVGPLGRVIAFEPNPINTSRLRENVALNGFENVVIISVALGARPGTLPMTFVPSMLSAGTLRPSSHPFVANSGDARVTNVAVERLDDLIVQRVLPPPSVVKIDIEGFEGEALDGMHATLSNHQPRGYVEIHGEDWRARQVSASAVAAILLASGYRECRHVELGRIVALTNIMEIGAEGWSEQAHVECSPS